MSENVGNCTCAEPCVNCKCGGQEVILSPSDSAPRDFGLLFPRLSVFFGVLFFLRKRFRYTTYKPSRKEQEALDKQGDRWLYNIANNSPEESDDGEPVAARGGETI